MSETYVRKFDNGDNLREYLETSARVDDYVVYYNRLHRVVDCGGLGLRIAVCSGGEGE